MIRSSHIVTLQVARTLFRVLKTPRLVAGVVHAWIGQIVLKCNVFKTIFVRPTDTRVPNHDDA